MMHMAVRDFIATFEVESHRKGQYRQKLGKSEVSFLEKVWGPAFHYDFDGLRAEYPMKDFRDGDRFPDFIYTKGGNRLLIEVDGFTTHARDISLEEFDAHLARQNDLILQGWIVLRFSANQVEKQPMLCQRVITQAVGHWWMTINRVHSVQIEDIWKVREQDLIQIGLRNGGFVRVQDLPLHFRISIRTARQWLTRFTASGLLEPVKSHKYTVCYQLAGYGDRTVAAVVPDTRRGIAEGQDAGRRRK